MSWQKREQPAPIQESMIEYTTKLPSGATFTRLKPGNAKGAETVETWKDFRL
jgi:hypothetical protein